MACVSGVSHSSVQRAKRCRVRNCERAASRAQPADSLSSSHLYSGYIIYGHMPTCASRLFLTPFLFKSTSLLFRVLLTILSFLANAIRERRSAMARALTSSACSAPWLGVSLCTPETTSFRSSLKVTCIISRIKWCVRDEARVVSVYTTCSYRTFDCIGSSPRFMSKNKVLPIYAPLVTQCYLASYYISK